MQIADTGTRASPTPANEAFEPRGQHKGNDFAKELVADGTKTALHEQLGVQQTMSEEPVFVRDGVGSQLQQDAQLEQLLYPWQLTAQAALSQLGHGAYSGSGSGSGVGESIAAAGALQGLTSAAGVASSSPAPAPLGNRSLDESLERNAAAAQVAFASSRHVEGNRSGLQSSNDQTVPSLAAWAERIQRRTEDAQGRATVWLRDYRLDAAGLDQAVNEIIAFYGAERPVWRIVHNGSEIWRQPNNLVGEY